MKWIASGAYSPEVEPCSVWKEEYHVLDVYLPLLSVYINQLEFLCILKIRCLYPICRVFFGEIKLQYIIILK